MVNEKSKNRQGHYKFKNGWIMILLVYMTLFGSTAYIAFIAESFSPARMKPEIINEFENEDIKSYVIEILKNENTIYAKRRELAQQSFNVVLGAILGFLSASATSLIGIRREPDDG